MQKQTYKKEWTYLLNNFKIRCNSKAKVQTRFIVYLGLFLIYALCFYFQTIKQGTCTGYVSDTIFHCDFALQIFTAQGLPKICKAYPMTYVLLAGLCKVFGKSMGAAILAGAMAVISSIIVEFILRYFLDAKKMGNVIVLISALMNLYWPIYVPILAKKMQTAYDIKYWSFYLSTGSGSPIHNITVLGVKPFMLVCVFLFIWLINEFNNVIVDEAHTRAKKQNIVLAFLSVFMILANLAKPNFYQFFAPAGAAIVVFCLFKYGFKSFWFCCKIGLSFVPSTIQILFISVAYLNNLGIDIMPFYEWKTYCANIPMAIVCALTFSIFIAILCVCTKQKNTPFNIALCFVITAMLEYIFMIEKAEIGSANFMWGYNSAQFLLAIFSFIAFIQILNVIKTKKAKAIVGTTGAFLLSLHVFSGICAFIWFILHWYSFAF